jgi:molybdenum cofactor guanylyltransferase
MGRDKALVAFRGRPLAAYGFNALREAGATRTLAIGGDGPALVEIGYEAVADRHPGEGPLGGVLTALNASDTALMAILACDQPAVDAALILELLSTLETVDADAAVVAVAGRHHPLPMAIRASAATHLLAAYRAGERSLVGALRSLRVQALARQTDATVFDLDDPADLRRYAADDPQS